MSFFILVPLFILGTVFGSFINVVIDRIPRGESILGGRSYCEKCKKHIKPYDMIPVLSYVVLSGKCRNCKSKIPKRVFIVEVLSGLIFSILFIFVPTTLLLLALLCAISLILLAIAIIDIEHGIISDLLLIIVGMLALFYVFFSGLPLLSHLLAGFVAFLFLCIVFAITRGKGIGFGDVKFAFVMGVLLGPLLTVVAFYVAFLTGALLSIILVLGQKKKFKGSTIPFGPFLSLGVFVSILFGNEILGYVRPFVGF